MLRIIMEKSKSTPYWGIISLSNTRLAQSNKENIDGTELIFWYTRLAQNKATKKILMEQSYNTYGNKLLQWTEEHGRRIRDQDFKETDQARMEIYN